MVQPMFTVSAANVYGFQTYIQGTVCGGIGCLFIRLRLYFQRTVRVECSLFIKFLNISPGNYLPGCSLFIWFLILPPGNCLSGCRGLSTGSAAFFYLFRTYIQVAVRWGASCFYSHQTYLQGGVFAMSQSFFISFWSVCFPRLTDNQTKAVRISSSFSLSLSLSLSLSFSRSLSGGTHRLWSGSD